MSDLDAVIACWRSLDDRFERVVPTTWGAVVTDARYPLVHDVNYARVERRTAGVDLREIEADLRAELDRVRTAHLHIVLFHPEPLARLSWEVVMTRRSTQRRGAERIDGDTDPAVREVRTFGPTFWRAFDRSAREFGAVDPAVAEQRRRLEADVLLPAGKRWFTVRWSGRAVAFGTLLVAGPTALIDHVVTLPRARRRGYATAIVHRLCEEAGAAGADLVWLITEPRSQPERLYRRLGFRRVATIASTLRARSI